MNYEQAKQIPVNLVRELLNHASDHLPDCADAVEYVQAYLTSCKEDHTRFDAVRWLSKMFTHLDWQQVIPTNRRQPKDKDHDDWYVVQTEKLKNLALLRYLEHRGVKNDLAKELLKEVHLHNDETNEAMYVLGFPNEERGFAVIGPFIETLIGRRAISILRQGIGICSTIHIFPNFIDMLAAFSAFPTLRQRADVIVLNSPDLLNSAFAHISGFGYRKIYSWFPNTKEGDEQILVLTKHVKTDKKLKHMVCNDIYRGYETFGKWHQATCD